MLEAQLKLAYENGYADGIKQVRDFGDKDKNTYYALNKLFEHLGIKNDKLVNKYKAYILAEAEAISE
jgi:hypothetical protein